MQNNLKIKKLTTSKIDIGYSSSTREYKHVRKTYREFSVFQEGRRGEDTGRQAKEDLQVGGRKRGSLRGGGGADRRES